MRFGVRKRIRNGTAVLLIGLLLPFTLIGRTPAREATPTHHSDQRSSYTVPLGFEENRGQFQNSAQFSARGGEYILDLDSTYAGLKLQSRNGKSPVEVRMVFSGGNAARLVGEQPLPGVSHYLLAPAPKSWVRDVRSYARVRYESVYPGIDLVFTRDAGNVEYDFVVAAGADSNQIQLSFTGITGLRVDANGDLVLETAAGEVHQKRPYLYQDMDGIRRKVAGGFVIEGRDQVRFRVGPHDTGAPLIIDPVLVYSTLYGGSRGYQGIQDVTVDEGGNAYVVGYYPWDGDRGPSNLFVSKFAPDGQRLFATTFGSYFADDAGGIALDKAGNIYITGSTEPPPPGAPMFPTTPDAFQPAHGGGTTDAFVTKLDPAGSTILYSTFLGGAGQDIGSDIDVDTDGRIYVTGSTDSANFPTSNAVQPQLKGATDVFVAVFQPAGTALVFSTYLGGSGNDTTARLALFDNGVTIAGTTSSPDFPTLRSIQPNFGGGTSDAFIAQLSSAGALMSSTYLGGSADEQASGVAVDRLGFTIVTGSTNSSDFPTVRPLQPTLSFAPEADAFLVKLTPNASGLIYATYLDIGADARCPETYPTLNDPCGGVAVDIRGNAYVNAGSPLSRGVFVIKVDAAGRRRVYTFNGFGGEAIALNPTRQLLSPEIFVAGRTRASIFPVLNAYDSSRKSFETEEGFLMKLIDGPNPRASFEETDARITYTGTWEVDTASDHSRGAAMRSQEAGATASITFTGTGIQVIGRRDPSAGIFTVMQTTEPFPLVDAYASPAEPRSLLLSISDLPPGTYTLTLKVTGTHNNRATGQWIWIDGFNVIGAP